MYLHIGNDKMIRSEDVLIILNHNILNMTENKKWLKATSLSQPVSHEAVIKDTKPRSIVVTDNKIYFSTINPETIAGRG